MKKAKRFLSVLLTLCMVLGMLPGAAFAANSSAPFSDVDASDWYSGAVQYVYENGMMSGTGNGKFSPDVATTRGMIVTILHKMEGCPTEKGQSFDDVAQDQYYAGAVAWASANDIVSGYGNGKFGPNDTITREQLAVILYGYAQHKGNDVSVGEDTNILSYTDFDQLAEWAIPAMQWACGAGLISGMGDGVLAPKGNATRAQVAMILMKFCGSSETTTDVYTVTFQYNYGDKGTYTTAQVEAGEKVDRPASPTRKGYNFNGWYTKAEGGEKFSLKTPITEDLVLYAHWSVAPSSSGSSDISMESVNIMRAGADVSGVELKSGDVLSVYVLPEDATYSIKWFVGEREAAATEQYTVSALDVGQSITAELTGTGSYTGTVTSQATGTVVASLNVYDEVTADSAPVVVDTETVVFKTDATTEVDVSSSSLDYRVETDTSADAVNDETSEDLMNAIVVGIEGVEEEDAENIPVDYVAVDADLILVTEENGQTTETPVHPVGTTTVTLSKENLGLTADEDISKYVFFANHTNIEGIEENVAGEVVTIDGVQYVRFVLNGLSRIYIGNVPPLTVTFDTDGGSEIPAQKVKLGGYAVDVEPPVKAGWLFAGWDHDIQTENIIKDITVTARWIQGTTAADDQLTGAWKQDGQDTTDPENVAKTVANGTVTLTLQDETVYAANLSYHLTVAPIEGAVKMATATTAEGAMAAGETDYADAAPVEMTAFVTGQDGCVQTSNTNLYIKWIAEDGSVLGLQSARLVVRTPSSALGNYDTQTRVETVAVNRGLGQVEFYLTNGTNEAGNPIPDYVGVINGYLDRYDDEYTLDVYASFYEDFWDSETQEYYNGDNYSGIKIVISPFEGESFSTVPTVSAFFEEQGSTESVDYTDSVTTTLENGNIVLTCAKPGFDAEYAWLYFDLSLNGVNQSFSFDFDNYSYTDEEWTTLRTESWDEALTALANGTNRVYYRGTESVTLNTALTLQPEQALYFNNYNNEVNLTIGNGGVLTVMGDDLHGADVYVWNGKLIVENGGTLTTNSQNADQNRYYNVGVQAEQGVTVKNGGLLNVPTYGYMRVYNGQGGFLLEQGGQLTNAQRLYMDRDSDSAVDNVLAGTVTVTDNGYLEFNDGLTMNSTGNVTIANNCRFYVYGGLIVNAGGQVTCDGRYVSLSGRSENYGTITMNAGRLEMWNTGYSVYNNGTIYVDSDAYMNIEGTVLVNTGALTGSGTIYTYEMNDSSSYDNGIEYVEVEDTSDRTPSNYDRYQFVRDPAATVDVIYFIGELSNQNGGTSTLTKSN